jgi:hypothetical protein
MAGALGAARCSVLHARVSAMLATRCSIGTGNERTDSEVRVAAVVVSDGLLERSDLDRIQAFDRKRPGLAPQRVLTRFTIFASALVQSPSRVALRSTNRRGEIYVARSAGSAPPARLAADDPLARH